MSSRTASPPPSGSSRLVGVIASMPALDRATRLNDPPDFFELRLDALFQSLGKVERALPRLRAPLILTARDPAEGGLHRLKAAARQDLILRFLDHAAFVDLESRNAGKNRQLREMIRERGVGLIISAHLLRMRAQETDFVRLMNNAARLRPAIFKLVVRTDNRQQLDRLVEFFTHRPAMDFEFAAMGLGRLALESRLVLQQLGSVLTYGAVGKPVIDGQPSLSQLRRASPAYIR